VNELKARIYNTIPRDRSEAVRQALQAIIDGGNTIIQKREEGDSQIPGWAVDEVLDDISELDREWRNVLIDEAQTQMREQNRGDSDSVEQD